MISERLRFPLRLLALLWATGRPQILLCSLFIVLPGVVTVASVAFLCETVDQAVAMVRGQQSLAPTLVVLGLFLTADLARAVVSRTGPDSPGHTSTGSSVLERLKVGVQRQLLEKVSHLPLAALDDSAFHDRLYRAQQGIDDRMHLTIAALFRLPSACVTAAALLGYVGGVHWFFAVVLLLGVLPSQLLGASIMRSQLQLQRALAPSRRRLEYLGDLLTSRSPAGELRLCQLPDHLVDRWQDLFHHTSEQLRRLSRRNLGRNLITELSPQLAYGVVILGVVVLIAQGQLTVGHFVAFLSAALNLREVLLRAIDAAQTLAVDHEYLEDLLGCLAMAEDRRDERADLQSPADDGPPVVRFESVAFTYPGAGRPALRDVTFQIDPGERLALVGPNGAGKTTIVRLLLGLYRPTSGRITVDGLDLQNLDESRWRRMTGVVFQDFGRYHTTVRDNIGFGDIDRLDDGPAIRHAAALSGADSFITAMPSGDASFLGAGYGPQGRDLSAGQWQKLAIARAYFRKSARIIALDEPTASLDPMAEVDVYLKFEALAEDRSVLLISHRLGSARLAHRILVVDDGRITEEGTHEQLIARGGAYARLFGTQAEWYR